MKIKKIKKIHTILCSIFILTMFLHFPCMASEEKKFDTNDGEVVFMLDTSVSMNGHDEDRLAVDAVRQAFYSLPSNYKAGLVAYNTGIQERIPFSTEQSQWDEKLDAIEYTGYTNAGEALKQAVEMFSDQEKTNRYVIILTDGEIDMPDAQQKEDSRLLYEKMAKEAGEKGIVIYIIASGSEWSETGVHIFDGAGLTGGTIYWEGQSGSISEIMKHILYDRMNFPRSAVGSAKGIGGKLSMELPASAAEHARIVLTTERKFENISAEYAAEDGTVIIGKKFAVVDIEKPLEQKIEISYESTDVSDVEACLTVDYAAEIKTKITYRTEEDPTAQKQDTQNVQTAYKHIADIEIWLSDTQGRNENLWDGAYYEGRQIAFTVNEALAVETIHRGRILHSIQIDGISEAALELDVANLSEQFSIGQPCILTFSPPADPVPEPNYVPLWVILGVLLLTLTVILTVLVKKSRETVIYMANPSGNEAKKEEIKGCTYTGKLNMYVIQTQTGQDIAPQTYRLFGRQNTRITLNQILNSCGIKFGKIGAEDISFYAGPDKALIVMDQSEKCTVLRGTEILKKGMGYPVYYNGKLTVTFEDGITEMEIHYKNLKPSEQQNI